MCQLVYPQHEIDVDKIYMITLRSRSLGDASLKSPSATREYIARKEQQTNKELVVGI